MGQVAVMRLGFEVSARSGPPPPNLLAAFIRRPVTPDLRWAPSSRSPPPNLVSYLRPLHPFFRLAHIPGCSSKKFFGPIPSPLSTTARANKMKTTLIVSMAAGLAAAQSVGNVPACAVSSQSPSPGFV